MIHSRNGLRAFSLVELLASLGVVALLATLTVSALGGSRGKVLQVQCLSNLRTIGAASALYAADNASRLPGTQHNVQSWVGTLQPYITKTTVYLCPADPNRKQRAYSYAVNDFLTQNPYGAESLDYSRQVRIPKPSRTIFMAENAQKTLAVDHFHFADPEEGYGQTAFAKQVATSLHRKAANYLFADFHVENLTWTTVQTQLTQSANAFVYPPGNGNAP